jgi:hypothetical protein
VSGVPAAQMVYARWLEWGTRVGLWLLIVAFAAYVFGVIEPHVELSRLPALWGLPAERYQAMAGAPGGWGWLGFLDKGDHLNLLAVAFLSLITVACYLRILPIHFRRGKRLLAAMILLQIVVLLAAASGTLAGGH